MIGYKVVQKIDRCLYSFNFPCIPTYRSLYEIGHTAVRRPGYGPLALFASLLDARRFLSTFTGLVIGKSHVYRASYTPSKDTKLWVERPTGPSYSGEVPHGTIFADSITLLEEIK